MDAFATALIEHGAVGILALILLWLYTREKGEVRRLNTLITQLQIDNQTAAQTAERSLQEVLLQKQEEKLTQIDEIRLHQIAREQEFADTIQAIGTGTLEAIDKCETVAHELRRLHDARNH